MVNVSARERHHTLSGMKAFQADRAACVVITAAARAKFLRATWKLHASFAASIGVETTPRPVPPAIKGRVTAKHAQPGYWRALAQRVLTAITLHGVWPFTAVSAPQVVLKVLLVCTSAAYGKPL